MPANGVGEFPDLPLPAALRNDRKNRFIVRPGQELKLSPLDHAPEARNKLRVMFQQPVKQGPCPVLRELHAGMTFQHIDKRTIRTPEGLLEDGIEVPDRLMVMNCKCELNGLHSFRIDIGFRTPGRSALPPGRGIESGRRT
jgi:hypothetical protein